MPPLPELPVVVLSCQVLQDLLGRLLPPGLAREVIYLDYGLHRVPGNMTPALQDRLEAIPQPNEAGSDFLVILPGGEIRQEQFIRR